MKKEIYSKLYRICSYGIFPKGLKNEFETAVVIEPIVFEPLKVYYICIHHSLPFGFFEMLTVGKANALEKSIRGCS